jgi:hypothetical protein
MQVKEPLRASSQGYAHSVISAWEPESEGLLILPSGRTVRGRGLRRPLPAAGQEPTFALYLRANITHGAPSKRLGNAALWERFR